MYSKARKSNKHFNLREMAILNAAVHSLKYM